MMAKWPGCRGQWSRFSIPTVRITRYIIGANLVILAQIHYKLSCRQATFPKIPRQNDRNDLKGQGQWPTFPIPVESISGCMFGTNLVILAQICDKLSTGQAEFRTIVNQNDQNELEGQDRCPPMSIPTGSTTGGMFVANLVILAQICD